jgi:ribosome recycling factor
LTEDDKKADQDAVQKATDNFVKKIDDVAAAKEKELTTI